MKKLFLFLFITIMSAVMLTIPVVANENAITDVGVIEINNKVCYASQYAGDSFEKGSFNAVMYEKVKAYFINAAKGKEETSYFTVDKSEFPIDLSMTKDEVGANILENGNITDAAWNALEKKLNEVFNLDKIVSAVLADLPYEQFWYDKSACTLFEYAVSATSKSISIAYLKFEFDISEDYQGATPTTFDQAKLTAARQGVESAKFIVDEYKNHSDFDKLKGYAEKICFHASYNHDAVRYNASYGNPWQIIYVFDGLTDTKVVCEGYAKAFKYLCDLTDFDGDVKCYTVMGTMNGGTGAGAHMWNIVTYNGENYLVDVTNCDSGTIGNGLKLFMRGVASSDGGKTYKVPVGSSKITYTYDESQKDLFGKGYLVLATKDADACTHSNIKTITEKSSTCTEKGWKKYKKCEDCGEMYNQNGAIITEIPYLPLAAHTPTQVKDDKYLLSKGNCTRPSLYFESCKICKKALNDTFEGEKSAHDVVDVWFVENGYHFHRCSVCTYKEDYGKCSGGTATCTSQAKCDICKMPYGDFASHKFGAWKTDSTTHWKECSCYQKNDIGQHTDKNSDGKCDSCAYSMPVASEPPKDESTPSVDESKPPIVDESKPSVDESKPPIVDESKPSVDESKPVVNESKPTVSVESIPPVVDESVIESEDESISLPEISDESIDDTSSVSTPDESETEKSEAESIPPIADESISAESETVSEAESIPSDESEEESKPSTSYSQENINAFNTKTIIIIAVSTVLGVAVIATVIIIVKKKK